MIDLMLTYPTEWPTSSASPPIVDGNVRAQAKKISTSSQISEFGFRKLMREKLG
jgi:hypothetical protein